LAIVLERLIGMVVKGKNKLGGIAAGYLAQTLPRNPNWRPRSKICMYCHSYTVDRETQATFFDPSMSDSSSDDEGPPALDVRPGSSTAKKKMAPDNGDGNNGSGDDNHHPSYSVLDATQNGEGDNAEGNDSETLDRFGLGSAGAARERADLGSMIAEARENVALQQEHQVTALHMAAAAADPDEVRIISLLNHVPKQHQLSPGGVVCSVLYTSSCCYHCARLREASAHVHVKTKAS
jgi:hypothetical protein